MYSLHVTSGVNPDDKPNDVTAFVSVF